jgi:hypothetical protein
VAAFVVVAAAAVGYGRVGRSTIAPAVAYTQADIDELKIAIASGELISRAGNRSVQYRSLDEMQRTLRLMEAEVAGTRPGLVLGRNKASFRRD